MKTNQPMKYTVIQVSDEFPVYIVTKCFLAEQITRFLEDGTTKKEYRVEIPYSFKARKNDDIKTYKNNSIIADKLFDTYDIAKKYANALNEKVLENVSHEQNSYDEKIKQYEELEQFILSSAIFSKLKIEDKNHEIILYNFNNSYPSIVNLSTRELLKLYNNEEFLTVYSLSDEEFNYFKKQINNKNMPLDFKYQGKYLLISNEYKKLKICNGYSNDEDIPFINPVNFASIVNNGKKVLTTETYEDIISKYIYYTNIPESIVKDFKHKSLVLIK